MVPKCGKFKVWHWAHKVGAACDPWWENETEWHRAWKALFPDHWQEVIQHSADGEKHIADVKTEREWVIEFQHSSIDPEERRAREAFYRQLVWVVDGTRRKKDPEKFFKAWTEGASVADTSLVRVRRVRVDDCVLLREWSDSAAPVLLDFCDGQGLVWLLPSLLPGFAYVAGILRGAFVEIHRKGVSQTGPDFGEFVRGLRGLVTDFEAQQARAGSRSLADPFNPIRSSRGRSRRRF